MIKKYNKLVRDRIPEIIAQNGKTAQTEILSSEEYLQKLLEKAGEETDEFIASLDPEELADLLEVVYALAEHVGCTRQNLEQLRKKKHRERGGFTKRILLVQVSDQNDQEA